jgi:DNA-binding MarR family transcriptional regulator
VPFPGLPLDVLVVLFLSIFVLIGISPALKRIAKRIRKLVHSAAQSKELVVTAFRDVHAEIFTDHPGSRQLNDFEIIVLRRLAQAGDKNLSRKQVNEHLLLGKAILHKTLKSLHRRGLIHVKLSTLLGQRFTLSEAGRQYAIEQGYIINIH